MLRVLIPIVLLGGAATAAVSQVDEKAAARGETAIARDLAGLTPGKPQKCIRQLEARSSTAYGNTILFKVSSGLVYRNDMGGACSKSPSDALVTRTPNNLLCSGEIAQTYDPMIGVQSGSCVFNEFVPYRRARR
ncbi:MAG: hypothetical protein V4659_12735 [Pseudomonadota bacterium]